MVYQRDKTAQRKGVEKGTLKGGITCFSWHLEGSLEKLLAIFGPSLLRTNRSTASEMSIVSAAMLVFDDCTRSLKSSMSHSLAKRQPAAPIPGPEWCLASLKQPQGAKSKVSVTVRQRRHMSRDSSGIFDKASVLPLAPCQAAWPDCSHSDFVSVREVNRLTKRTSIVIRL